MTVISNNVLSQIGVFFFFFISGEVGQIFHTIDVYLLPCVSLSLSESAILRDTRADHDEPGLKYFEWNVIYKDQISETPAPTMKEASLFVYCQGFSETGICKEDYFSYTFEIFRLVSIRILAQGGYSEKRWSRCDLALSRQARRLW
jgi:hypothetical protein